jgi:hypothetical protein
VLAGVDLVRAHTHGRGIWAVDRGGDRKKLLEPLLDRRECFVIRSTGKRLVVDRKNMKRSVTELGARCRLRYQARIVKIQDGQEKIYHLRYGVERIRLLGRATNCCTWWWSSDSERNRCYCSRMRWRERGTRHRLVDRANLSDALEN